MYTIYGHSRRIMTFTHFFIHLQFFFFEEGKVAFMHVISIFKKKKRRFDKSTFWDDMYTIYGQSRRIMTFTHFLNGMKTRRTKLKETKGRISLADIKWNSFPCVPQRHNKSEDRCEYVIILLVKSQNQSLFVFLYLPLYLHCYKEFCLIQSISFTRQHYVITTALFYSSSGYTCNAFTLPHIQTTIDLRV